MVIGDIYLARLKQCAQAASSAPATPTPGSMGWGTPLSTALPTYTPPPPITSFMAVAPPPAECVTKNLYIVNRGRYGACVLDDSTGKIVIPKTGEVLGTFSVQQVTIVKGAKLSAGYDSTFYIRMYHSTGVGRTSSYGLQAVLMCYVPKNTCAGTEGQLNSTLGSSWLKVTGKVKSSLGMGTKGTLSSVWGAYIKPSASSTIAGRSAASPQLRCDNNVVWGMGHGCVNDAVILAQTWDTQNWPTVAVHIDRAQETGLDYWLTRAWPTEASANRDKACDHAPQAKPLYSCDEYPYASTKEGASTGGGPMRVLSGCGYKQVAGSGPSGWSRCQVIATDNTNHGNSLSKFYKENRIIPGDYFGAGVVGLP